MSKCKKEVYSEYLVLRCQDGDRLAFGELVSLWQKPLYRYALRIVGAHQPVQDILQDSWIAVAKQLLTLREASHFKKWVYRIVSNKCIDWIRKQERIRKLKDRYEAELRCAEKSRAKPREDMINSIRDAVDLLPLEQKVLVTLFYLEELSLQEISYAMKIPIGTVKSRLHKVRKNLRTIVKKEGNNG